ncbi:hypothetical protein G4Y79_17545 [Phototrophicus methaneseepsis]|uniref:Uncharacterized protein n=1 Tax=Phototrophicus methaneseepsis TaxID=2710758 RepID=A0A7S8E6W7_9CHLR|nr:hypothetical protein [Phototrophicus methaneseepsis]QPC81483.1 hypothetical protein G4Y79_17545 [Phototrophicus methaneseepsis]
MVSHDTNTVMVSYVDAYEKLYKRSPSGLRALDENWVIVNGARMQINELENLTQQLLLEYRQLQKKKNMINRLITWFRG